MSDSKSTEQTIKSKLLAYIESVYAKYSTIDYSVLQDLRNAFGRTPSKLSGLVGEYPLQVFRITPTGITYETEKPIPRMEMNFTLLKNMFAYAKKHNLPIPTTTMYLWVGDSHPYYVPGIDQKFPIMSYVSPTNFDYILFPDDSFVGFQIGKKYAGKWRDFNYVKNIIKTHVVPIGKKLNTIYFKGTPTTDRQSLLREDFEQFAKSNSKVIVKLDAWQSYEPLFEWSKYRWLLNLPGRYPWSNRMKWLFLMKSAVINVDTSTVGPDYVDKPYKTFINLIVEPGVDYINIEHNYNNKIRPGRYPTADDLEPQHKENRRIFDKILEISSTTTTSDYKAMVASAYKKVSAINNDLISWYIYQLVLANSKLIQS